MESKALESNETEGKSLDQSIQNDRKPLSREEIVMEKEQVMAIGHEGEKSDNIETPLLDIAIDALAVGYHPRKKLGDIEKLQGSIRRDGLQEPLLVYEDGEGKYFVIDGCRRLEALRAFGWKTVPCLVRERMETADAAHLSYVKNTERNALNSIEIAIHMSAMRDRFGFSLRELEIKGYGSPATISNNIRLLELPDKVQSQIAEGKLTAAHGIQLLKLNTQKERDRFAKQMVDHEITAKKAEFQINQYLLKGHKDQEKKKRAVPDSDIPGVYIKDSRDMSELPNKSVHLIVSSPPYFVGKEYEVGTTFDEHTEMVKGVLKECARVLVDGGIMALNVGDIHRFRGRKGKNKYPEHRLMGSLYQNELRKHKISLTDNIVWRKPLSWIANQHLGFGKDTKHCSYSFLLNWEPIYIFRKEGQREEVPEELELRSKLSRAQWMELIKGVWDINPINQEIGHPAVFPDEIPKRLIQMFSYEGDTVLDPWLGSGTTVKVARELGREGVGYEKEPRYKEVIMKRLEAIGEKSREEVVGPMTQILTNMKEELEKMEEAPLELSRAAESEGVISADDYFEMNEMEQW